MTVYLEAEKVADEEEGVVFLNFDEPKETSYDQVFGNTDDELVFEEDAKEEIVEETPVEEAVEEIIEETPVEEAVEEIIEEAPVEETAEEIIEEAPVEEAVEEIIEEAPVEEAVEEIIEEAPVEETADGISEEVFFENSEVAEETSATIDEDAVEYIDFGNIFAENEEEQLEEYFVRLFS